MTRRNHLSELADSLLAEMPRDPLAPHYSETTFKKKLELAQRREPKLPCARNCMGYDYLFTQEWAAVLATARLTFHQYEVVNLRFSGWTFEAIGRKRGHSKQGALNIFLQALKKIERARNVYAYVGLGDSYRELTRRGRGAHPHG